MQSTLSHIAFSFVALLFCCLISQSASAANFECHLASPSSFKLPHLLHVTFASDGQAVIFSNSETPSVLNCTLRFDRMNGSHLVYMSRGGEGRSREADILALSVEAFAMTINGEDAEPIENSAQWSGDYGCKLAQP